MKSGTLGKCARLFSGLLFAVAYIAPSQAYNLAGYQWTDSSTTFYAGISGAAPSGSAWNDAFVSAAASWNTRTLFDFNVFTGSADPCAVPTGVGDRNGIAFSADKCGSAFGATTLAITRNWSVGDELVQSGIVFNDATIAWDVYYGPWHGSQNADFRRVAVHELGHALGLSHSPGGIMASYAGNTTSPTADDIAGVNAIYGEPAPPVEEPPPPPPEPEPPPPDDSPPPSDSPPPADDPPPEDSAPPPANPPSPPVPPTSRPDEIFIGGFEADEVSAGKNLAVQGAIPISGDFDGDDLVDTGSFRALDGLWTIHPGDGGVTWRYRLGGPQDVPAIVDFDGDGRDDLSVWSPQTKRWLVKPSSGRETLSLRSQIAP